MTHTVFSLRAAGALTSAVVAAFVLYGSGAPTPPPASAAPMTSQLPALPPKAMTEGPGRSAGSAQKTEPKKPTAPIMVSAEKLAQAVQDDVIMAAMKYHLVELRVEGVVAGHSEIKGSVGMIQFKPRRPGPATVTFSVMVAGDRGDLPSASAVGPRGLKRRGRRTEPAAPAAQGEGALSPL
jgi:hypothetical protein